MTFPAVLRKMWRDINTPSSYRDDWKSWVDNQCGHLVVGVALTTMVSAAAFAYFGEFAPKGITFLIVFALFAIQQWKQWVTDTWDTIEDTIFTVLYGAGTVILMFSEIDPGNPNMIGNILNFAGIFAIVATHFAVGATTRAYRELRHGTD